MQERNGDASGCKVRGPKFRSWMSQVTMGRTQGCTNGYTPPEIAMGMLYLHKDICLADIIAMTG